MQAPALDRLLVQALEGVGRPAAFVLAGHNGSGKSTLWDSRLSPMLHMPLINADRLTLSILPQPGSDGKLPAWAQTLRDDDERWQILSQRGVRAYKSLVMEEAIPFAFETVFSHWKPRAEGGHESKADDIVEMQAKGYFVVLIFVGLIGPDISVLRVATRRQQGGHDVERGKLLARFPRTQAAVAHAAPVADMTLMFDNSLGAKKAFTLVRAQRKAHVHLRCARPALRSGSGSHRRQRPVVEQGGGRVSRHTGSDANQASSRAAAVIVRLRAGA